MDDRQGCLVPIYMTAERRAPLLQSLYGLPIGLLFASLPMSAGAPPPPIVFDGSNRLVLEADERRRFDGCPPIERRRHTRLFADGRIEVTPPLPGVEPGTALRIGPVSRAFLADALTLLLTPGPTRDRHGATDAPPADERESSITVHGPPPGPRTGAHQTRRLTHRDDVPLSTLFAELRNLTASLAAQARTKPVWVTGNPWPPLCTAATRARHGLQPETPPWCAPPAFSRPDPSRSPHADPAVRRRLRERLARLPRGPVSEPAPPCGRAAEPTPPGIDLKPDAARSSQCQPVAQGKAEAGEQQQGGDEDPSTAFEIARARSRLQQVQGLPYFEVVKLWMRLPVGVDRFLQMAGQGPGVRAVHRGVRERRVGNEGDLGHLAILRVATSWV